MKTLNAINEGQHNQTPRLKKTIEDLVPERLKRSITFRASKECHSEFSKAMQAMEGRIANNSIDFSDVTGDIREYFTHSYLPVYLKYCGLSKEELRMAVQKAIAFYEKKIDFLKWLADIPSQQSGRLTKVERPYGSGKNEKISDEELERLECVNHNSGNGNNGNGGRRYDPFVSSVKMFGE